MVGAQYLFWNNKNIKNLKIFAIYRIILELVVIGLYLIRL